MYIISSRVGVKKMLAGGVFWAGAGYVPNLHTLKNLSPILSPLNIPNPSHIKASHSFRLTLPCTINTS